uniref:WGS project CBMG000000000 data, contig CS5907-c003649 n=1 Tax=Fusarium acuminatum CS5907 TaxID=1318461 RepID=A0A090N561_9HYPO|nr:unnamed protein product [Fusarium acuminatum CS5907]
MAGIAKIFEEATGDEYLAGLWKSRFVESLNWHVYDPKPSRSLDYRAPSWSWAAIDGAVTPHGPLSRTKLLVELVRATVVTKAPDRMSTILTAVAVLKARIIPAVFSRVDLDLATIQAPTGEFTVPVLPDTTDVTLIAGHQFAYLPLSYLSATTGRSDRYVTCLILERDTQSAGPQDRYRRLGSFSIGEEQGHDIEIICFSAEVKEIEII